MQSQPNAPRKDRRGSRARVEEGVYQRTGKWIIGNTGADGKWRMETLPGCRNLTEARQAREKKNVAVREGEAVVPSKATVGDVWQDVEGMYEGLVQAGDIAERTLQINQERWRLYLEPSLDKVRVQALRAEHGSRVFAEMRRRGLSAWTVRGAYSLLNVIIGHAISRGLISSNPLARLSKAERPQGRNKNKSRRINSEEIARLLENATPTYRPVLATDALTALRVSELPALRWCDIDFATGVIAVRHQLSRATREKPARLLPLKTDAGVRDVPMTPELAKMLREHKLASRYSKDSDYVFVTESGRPMSQRNISRGLEKAAERAGLNEGDVPSLSMHDLRHTYISHLIRAGFDVVTVQRLAGHARPSITLDIYAGEFAERDRGPDLAARIAATGLGSVLGGVDA